MPKAVEAEGEWRRCVMIVDMASVELRDELRAPGKMTIYKTAAGRHMIMSQGNYLRKTSLLSA